MKKEAFEIKLNEYTKRAEELKAIFYVSKVKINTEETGENSSTSSNNKDCSPSLSKKIFTLYYMLFILSLTIH